VVVLVLCAVVVSWVVCLLAVRYATEHALRYDHSKPQRFHVGATPRLGGLGVVLGWVVSVWLVGVQFGYEQSAKVDLHTLSPGWLLVAALPLVGAGLLEDFHPEAECLRSLGMLHSRCGGNHGLARRAH
jgi:UDP-N-acetylmuramyl pentapeptide phosphotransferase/UDP-N-acetylglucosamine-1-phosphate transferase